MRSSKDIFAKRDQGLHPCQYPKCRDYGNKASKKYGVLCEGHAAH